MKYLQNIYEFIWCLFAFNYWITGGFVNRQYDRWCRQQLKDGITFTEIREYTAKMNGVKVWTANHPFSSFRTYDDYVIAEMYPTRYTKYLLKKEFNRQMEQVTVDHLNKLTAKEY